MTRRELRSWLRNIVCTAPFTLDDCVALFQLIHSFKPGGLIVDVYTKRGDKVFVRVDNMTEPPLEEAIDVT